MNFSILISLIVAFAIIWNLRSYANRDVAPRGAYRSFLVDASADAIKLEAPMRRRKPLHTVSPLVESGSFSLFATNPLDMPQFEFSQVDSTLYFSENFIPGLVADSSVTNWDF